MPDISDHSLPPLDLTGHEQLTEQFRAALAEPKPVKTPTGESIEGTQAWLREQLGEGGE